MDSEPNISAIGFGGGRFETSVGKTDKGFQANLRGASLIDLVQMECLSMGRSAVKIVGPGGVGFLYFSGGQIVHAILGNLHGEEAALEILGWSSGSFEKLPEFDWPRSETIFCVWQSLVMRAAQQRDEKAADNLVVFPGSSGDESQDKMNSLLARIQSVGHFTSAVEVSSEGTIRWVSGGDESLAGLVAYCCSVADQIGALLRAGELLCAECETTSGHISALRFEGGRTFGLRATGLVDTGLLREAILPVIATGAESS